MVKIIPYGDQALLINFEQKIQGEINRQVVNLRDAVLNSVLPGIRFLIPAYCSLVVGYKPHLINFQVLREAILELAINDGKDLLKRPRLLTIPVCYQEPYALDMAEVEKITGLSREQILEMHCGRVFQVFMLGFLPGFPYMGSLPSALHCARKSAPRLRVPSRSVGLAGYQTGIYPCQAPGGWQIIGQTPLEVFQGHKSQPFLFQAGDQVRFRSISPSQYLEQRELVKSEKFDYDSIYRYET